MSTTFLPVLLILGSGPNIGANVARVFAEKGYKIALASRKAPVDDAVKDQIHIPADLTKPESVASVFAQVTKLLGPPSVVVYNAGKNVFTPANNPLDLSLTDFQSDLAVNTISVFEAAKHAVNGFDKLPASASKTFIFTGNILNTEPILPLLSMGIGKAATAHLIFNSSIAYAPKGYKFYYADERKADGAVAGRGISGPAHAEFYSKLAETPEQGPWLATFVAEKGYVNFPGIGYVKDPST